MIIDPTLAQSATWLEIHKQPKIWRDWARLCDFNTHRQWIAEQNPEEIWFSGAGTSAFIGEIIVAGLEGQRHGPRLRAVASTDLVARPEAYLLGRTPLMINFGRSGNSSETVGTLQAINALAPTAALLNITCHGQSALARTQGIGPHRSIVLPAATHDQGFAMTSSFSTMLMTALSLTQNVPDARAAWNRAADLFDTLLPQFMAHIHAPSTYVPKRLVFLGNGALNFAAKEAALKVMELTAGKVACLWDSVLGFRHGPKSFIDDQTQIVIFNGSDTKTRFYEADLIAELRAQFPDQHCMALGPGGDIEFAFPDGAVWAAPLMVLFAQLMGAHWSCELGLNIDDPFAGQGTLTRVVSGVQLYKVQP